MSVIGQEKKVHVKTVKVFSGKPELMGGKYVIKIDLSIKQHGTYYLQVVQKNSSFTKKLRL